MAELTGAGDTIVALATAPQPAALAVVRVSGPRSHALVQSLVGGLPAARATALRTVRVGGRAIDEALILRFNAPASATGEDVVELHLHGSPWIAHAVIEALCAAGARRAEPGEFTRRAVLSGRMAPEQAEAVRALVEAVTIEGASQALATVRGGLGVWLEPRVQELTGILAQVEAWIDFSDEPIEPQNATRVGQRLARLTDELQTMTDQYSAARAWRSGLRIAILGQPNAGKSTLLNALVGHARALVSPQAGTTRDYIEAQQTIEGIPVTLVDTAGVRHSPDGAVEAEGIERARDMALHADVVLWLRHPDEYAEAVPETDFWHWLGLERPTPGPAVLELCGHADLLDAQPVPENVLRIVPVRGDGLQQLRVAIARQVQPAQSSVGASLVTDRQHQAVVQALTALRAAEAVLRHEFVPELLAEELYAAQRALALLRGEYDRDRTLDVIFSTFCVGK